MKHPSPFFPSVLLELQLESLLTLRSAHCASLEPGVVTATKATLDICRAAKHNLSANRRARHPSDLVLSFAQVARPAPRQQATRPPTPRPTPRASRSFARRLEHEPVHKLQGGGPRFTSECRRRCCGEHPNLPVSRRSPSHYNLWFEGKKQFGGREISNNQTWPLTIILTPPHKQVHGAPFCDLSTLHRREPRTARDSFKELELGADDTHVNSGLPAFRFNLRLCVPDFFL